MRIRDIIHQLGISEKSIRYYIDKGLIQPKKDENGYYNFSESDAHSLEMIQALRLIGLSVSDIHIMLNDKDSIPFQLICLEKKICKKKSELEWKYSIVSDLIENYEKGTSLQQLHNKIRQKISKVPSDNEDCLIDSIDAEMLAYYFSRQFMQESELTIYQQFLWYKLKESIISNQTNEYKKFRDFFYSEDYKVINSPLVQGNMYEEIAELHLEQLGDYLPCMISKIKQNLNNSEKMKFWNKHYYDHVLPSISFFDNKQLNKIMREMSPTFISYQTNINRLCEMLRDYILSAKGLELKHEIYAKLEEKFDMNIYHCSEFAYLYQM